MASDRLLDHVIGSGRDAAQDDALIDAHLTLYKQYWGRLQPLPGSVELLRWCAERGLRVVLASSASDEEMRALRSALDADEFISAATSSADAERGKPAPDIVQAALVQGEIDPRTAVFVGDAVWDGQAATKAGLGFIAVTCGGTSAAELLNSGAIEIWRDPADLLANVKGSALSTIHRGR
jgi:HAD superfamily hydrolase (TIGR01509 family)